MELCLSILNKTNALKWSFKCSQCPIPWKFMQGEGWQSGIFSENGGLKTGTSSGENIIFIKQVQMMHLGPKSFPGKWEKQAKMRIWSNLKLFFFFWAGKWRELFVWEGVALYFVSAVGCFQSRIKNEIKVMFSGHQYWLTFLCILFISLILHSFFYCQYRHLHYCWIQTKRKSVVHCIFAFHCLGNHERLARQTCEDTEYPSSVWLYENALQVLTLPWQ